LLNDLDHLGKAAGYILIASFGPFIFLALGLALRAAAVQGFAKKFGRTDVRRPEKSPCQSI
jgi:hypothetical protein